MTTVKQKAKSCLAILLSLCMGLGTLPAVAMADTAESVTYDKNGDGEVTYVSLGASNVNGFGLKGYLPEDITFQNYDDKNVYGYDTCPEGSYPDLVRDYMEETLGQNQVKMKQFAISSMRAEELRVLLDETYTGDSYTTWRFTGNGKWFENAAVTGGLNELRSDYQTEISKADLITIDIGLNNFGVYLSNEIEALYKNDQEHFGNNHDVSSIDPEIGEDYKKGVEYVKELITQYAPDYTETAASYYDIVDVLAYALIGFCVNFDKSVEKILELNDDATIVAVSIQNMVPDLVAVMDNVELPMGELCGALTQAANMYMAVGSPYSDEYLYTDLRADDGHVEFFLQDLIEYNGNPSSLSTDMIDCFQFYDTGLATIIQNYSTQEKQVAYDVYATILQYAAGYNTLDMKTVFNGWDTAETAFSDWLFSEVSAAKNALSSNSNYDYTLSENSKNTLLAIDGIETILAMGVRTAIGNAFFGHPNRTGHEQIKEAIVVTLEDQLTGTDAAIDYASKLLDLVILYGPNVLETLYNYADSEGYLDGYKAFRSDVEVRLNNWTVLLENAGSDPSALKAACDAIAADIADLIDDYDLDVTAETVGEWLADAAEFLAPYVREYSALLMELLKQYGHDAVDLLWKYAEENGVPEKLEAMEDQLTAWHDAIASADDKLAATKEVLEEMADFAVEYGILTEEQVAEFFAAIESWQNAAENLIDEFLDCLERANVLGEEALAKFEELREMIETAPERLAEEFENMTHTTTYTKTVDDTYLALGGATASGEKSGRTDVIYYDIVEAAWGMDSVNKAEEGLTADGILEYFMANEASIEEADIITYQMDAAPILLAAVNTTEEDVDWSNYLSDEELAQAEEIIAEIVGQIKAEETLTVSGLLDQLEATLAEQDFYGAEEVLAEMRNYLSEEELEQMNGYAEYLWNAVEEDAAYADEFLADIKDNLADTLTTLEDTPILRTYIENIVYAVVSYTVQTAQAMEYVATVNPDAEFLLVGMYNPLKGLTVNMDGTEVDLGEITEYAIDATNFYHTALALLYDNVIFVDVSDTTIQLDAQTLSIDMDDIGSMAGRLIGLLDKMYADANGHAYIAEQILGAVEFVDAYEPPITVLEEEGANVATVNAPEGGWKIGENTFTVTSKDDVACMVFIKRANGSYEKLICETIDGVHYFTANIAEGDEIVVAVKGDVNGDGVIDVADVVQMQAASLGKLELNAIKSLIADINGDETIDVADVVQVQATSLGKLVLSW